MLKFQSKIFINGKYNFKENMSNFVVIIAPADV